MPSLAAHVRSRPANVTKAVSVSSTTTSEWTLAFHPVSPCWASAWARPRSPACPNGGCPEIVREGDRLAQVRIGADLLGHAARDLRHLDDVVEPGAEEADLPARRRHALHLRLVLQLAKRVAVDHSVAVDGVRRADLGATAWAVDPSVPGRLIWRRAAGDGSHNTVIGANTMPTAAVATPSASRPRC